MPLAVRSSRESRSERCKEAFLLAPICKDLLAPTLVSDRANHRTTRYYLSLRSPLFTDTAVRTALAKHPVAPSDAMRHAICIIYIATIYVWPGSTPRQNEHHGACAPFRADLRCNLILG